MNNTTFSSICFGAFMFAVRALTGISLLFFVLLPHSTFGQGPEQSSLPKQSKRLVLHFRIVHNHIVIQLSVNDGPLEDFIFDTGSELTILNLDRVKNKHIKTTHVNGNIHTYGSGCPIDAAALNVRITSENRTELLHGSMPMISLSKMEEVIGIPLAGIFGFDYLRNFAFILDYSSRTITIILDKHFQYDGPAMATAMVHTDRSDITPRLPIIQTKITLPDSSQVDATMEIDTGSEDMLNVHAPFILKHAISPNSTDSGKPSAPVMALSICGDKYELAYAKIRAILLAGHEVVNPIVFYSINPKGISTTTTTDGELGNKLLSLFRIYFDAPHQKIFFE